MTVTDATNIQTGSFITLDHRNYHYVTHKNGNTLTIIATPTWRWRLANWWHTQTRRLRRLWWDVQDWWDDLRGVRDDGYDEYEEG